MSFALGLSSSLPSLLNGCPYDHCVFMSLLIPLGGSVALFQLGVSAEGCIGSVLIGFGSLDEHV